VTVTFHTKRVGGGFFGKTEVIEPECFEKWTIPCQITQIDFNDLERTFLCFYSVSVFKF
jgi:hypothetical protein